MPFVENIVKVFKGLVTLFCLLFNVQCSLLPFSFQRGGAGGNAIKLRIETSEVSIQIFKTLLFPKPQLGEVEFQSIKRVAL